MSMNGNPVSDFGLLDESQSFWQKLRKTQTAQIMLVLVVITAIFSLLAPDTFFTLFNLRNISINIAMFAILGIGMTFVIITAGIDLSIGSMLVFSSVIGCKAIVASGGQGWGSTIAGLFACKWMLSIVKKSKLSYFALYCFIVGIIAISITLLNN